MVYYKLHLFPMVIAIILPMNLAFTLVLAVIGHHVLPGWPYISDAGRTGKARGMFSVLCNIGATFMIVCAYFKYKHIGLWMEEVQGCDDLRSVNITALVFGILLGVGLHTAANFQTENVSIMHRIGAFTGFLSGVVYFGLLSWLGLKIPDSTPKPALRARIAIVTVATVVFFTTIIPGQIAAYQHGGGEYKAEWRKSEPGFYMHLTSTISEWVLALMIAYMFLTLVPDFQQMGLIGMPLYVESRT